MGWTGEDRQLGGIADCGHADPQRRASTRGAGQRSPEASSLVLRLALHNPAHQSYINSFVTVHLWCFSLLQVPEFPVFGSKAQAWRDILYSEGRPITVSTLPAWRSLFKGWRRPASPHDVVPFIAHVLTLMQPPLLQVGWESRALAAEATVVTTAKRQPVNASPAAIVSRAWLRSRLHRKLACTGPHMRTQQSCRLYPSACGQVYDTRWPSQTLFPFHCLTEICNASVPPIA